MKGLDETKNTLKLGCQRHAMETKTMLLLFIQQLFLEPEWALSIGLMDY